MPAVFPSQPWSFEDDLQSDYKTYGMPDLVGDPVKDAGQLKATSPVVQAARIRQPLLMAYGAADAGCRSTTASCSSRRSGPTTSRWNRHIGAGAQPR